MTTTLPARPTAGRHDCDARPDECVIDDSFIGDPVCITNPIDPIRVGDTDEHGDLIVAHRPHYVTATLYGDRLDVVTSIRCRDSQSWMAPLVLQP